MKLRVAMLVMAASAAVAAAARAQTSVIFRAAEDEMRRTVARLEVERLGKPYFLSLTVRDERQLDLEGVLGALRRSQEERGRSLRTDLRVGSPEFDNEHFVSQELRWTEMPGGATLPLDDDYDAVRHAVWLACDEAYRQAQATLARKQAYAQQKLIEEKIPDLARDPVRSMVGVPVPAALDRTVWEERVRRLSAAFRKHPALQDSFVRLSGVERHVSFVDSEGRKAFKPDHEIELYMEASAQAADGMRLVDCRRFVRRLPADLPQLETLEAAAADLAGGVSSLCSAPKWEGVYLGPILFDGEAAAEFFGQLLARNVSFPRSLWVESEYMEEDCAAGALAGRLGLRVTSPILSVQDDPGLRAFQGQPLAGYYEMDDEGIPAQRVVLVEKGILKDVLMSRSPIKERKLSNGHGRCGEQGRCEAHAGNMFITADKTVTMAALKEELLRQAKGFGLDYALIVRRIGPEERRNDGAGGRERLLASPVMLYKVAVADGKEQLVRGAEFGAVTLRALRDVVLAGDTPVVYNCLLQGRGRWSDSRVPAGIVCPSVLVAEMEVRESSQKPDKLPLLKRPTID